MKNLFALKTDGRTDAQTHGRTDGRTHGLDGADFIGLCRAGPIKVTETCAISSRQKVTKISLVTKNFCGFSLLPTFYFSTD